MLFQSYPARSAHPLLTEQARLTGGPWDAPGPDTHSYGTSSVLDFRRHRPRTAVTVTFPTQKLSLVALSDSSWAVRRALHAED